MKKPSTIEQLLRMHQAGNKGTVGSEETEKESPVENGSQSSSGAAILPFEPEKTNKLSPDDLLENRIVAGLSDGTYTEYFKILRTKLMHKLRADNLRDIAFTSPGEGAGKSFITANLAITLAMDESNTVVMVDLDLKSPKLHKYFSVEPEGGLVDCLKNKKSIDDYVINTGFERLYLLPCGESTPHSAELLSSAYMTNVLDEIRNYHTEDAIILFDLPPLLYTADTLIVLPYVDSCLLVVEDGVTTAEEVNQCLHMLKDSNCLGTVLNKSSDQPPANYRYYFRKSDQSAI